MPLQTQFSQLGLTIGLLLFPQFVTTCYGAEQIFPPSSLKCKDYVDLNEKAMAGLETWNVKAVMGLYYLAFAMGNIQGTMPTVFNKPAQSPLEMSNDDFFRMNVGLMSTLLLDQCKKQPDSTFNNAIRTVRDKLKQASQ